MGTTLEQGHAVAYLREKLYKPEGFFLEWQK